MTRFGDSLRADPRIQEAIIEFRDMISMRYPSATFSVSVGDDPVGVWLTAEIDLDDPDEVMDLIIDRLMAVQIDEGLPFYVLPVRTRERDEAVYARDHSRPISEETLIAAVGR